MGQKFIQGIFAWFYNILLTRHMICPGRLTD